jgi:hypothetical protein
MSLVVTTRKYHVTPVVNIEKSTCIPLAPPSGGGGTVCAT